VLETLPQQLKVALADVLSRHPPVPGDLPSTVGTAMRAVLDEVDGRLAHDLEALFPGGPIMIEGMPDEDIKALLNDR
jgi:hypothetical protein